MLFLRDYVGRTELRSGEVLNQQIYVKEEELVEVTCVCVEDGKPREVNELRCKMGKCL